ncbi:hypothetical protein JF66_02235 [Cryobacterium sp. MLB-32]|uniref:hypothetical protein n=1 Tax=Cryobacterium sp. MLB-32 TaxID=1529318 RepID=UPI0004E7ADB1|nr:hypothetical protein [Cryobacterium sp. MLB-32]KFF60776.1 hypothetical protein JF66_02235 [Cryobacterium sp. MLB-32]
MVPRSRFLLAALVTALLVSAGLIPATAGLADTAPPNPSTPTTVAADALPTPQINGVVTGLSVVWRRPTMSWTDTGRAGGSNVSYAIKVIDPFGNSVTGSAVGITITAAAAAAAVPTAAVPTAAVPTAAVSPDLVQPVTVPANG